MTVPHNYPGPKRRDSAWLRQRMRVLKPIVVTGRDFRAWRAEHELSLDAAADLLGIRPATLRRYDGLPRVPATIAWALSGLDMEQLATVVSGAAFRQWRLGRGLYQKEVAFLMGVSDQAIRAYESAEHIPLRYALAIAGIDKALGSSAVRHPAAAV